jgi:hypothetical protein
MKSQDDKEKAVSQFPEAKRYQLSELISKESVNDKYTDFILIGTGAAGEVYRAKDVSTGKLFLLIVVVCDLLSF